MKPRSLFARGASANCLYSITLAVAITALASTTLHAANIYWDGTGTWGTAAGAATPNPTAAGSPTVGDVAFFNISTLATNQTISLDANRSVQGIGFGGNADTFVTIIAVPEPDVAMLLGGLGMLALLRRRRDQ